MTHNRLRSSALLDKFIIISILGFLLSACNPAVVPTATESATVVTTAVTTIITATPMATSDTKMCDTVLAQVETNLSNVKQCSALGINQACYGNQNVTAHFKPQSTPVDFKQPGDLVGLDVLDSLQTAALNLANNEWGVALLQFIPESALDGTTPNVPVLFVTYGDADFKDMSFVGQSPQTMHAFYFANGIGAPTCQDLGNNTIPSGGLMMSSPAGKKVSFMINNATVLLGSVVIVHTLPASPSNPTGLMILTVLEGGITVQVGNQTESAPQGQEVWVVLGGTNGLTAQSFSNPPLHPMSVTGLDNICRLALASGVQLPPQCPGSVTLTPTPTAVGTSAIRAGITQPASGQSVTGTVNVVGSTIHPDFVSYRLELAPTFGDNPNVPITLIASTTAVESGILGSIDTTAFPNGVYRLGLAVTVKDASPLLYTVENITINNAQLSITSTPSATDATAPTPTLSLPTIEATLFVPTLTPTATSTPCTLQTGWSTYVVQAGDMLSGIAAREGVTWDALQTANCLPSSMIYVGQLLLVPYPILPPTLPPTVTNTPTLTLTVPVITKKPSFTPSPPKGPVQAK